MYFHHSDTIAVNNLNTIDVNSKEMIVIVTCSEIIKKDILNIPYLCFHHSSFDSNFI